MSRCEYAKVESVSVGPEGHGIPTAWVQLTLGRDGTSGQGFGGLALSSRSLLWWKQEVAAVFGLSDFESIVGRECYVLRAFGGWNERIEGIASLDGLRRFTITGFQRKHFPGSFVGRMEQETESIRNTIESLHARLVREKQRLREARSRFVDWETAEISEDAR